MLQHFINLFNCQFFNRCTCLGCFPSCISRKASSNCHPIGFCQRLLIRCNGSLFHCLELISPSWIDDCCQIQFFLTCDTSNRISCNFIFLYRKVFCTDGFDTRSLYIQCLSAVRRESSQTTTQEEILHLSIQSLISSNHCISLVTEWCFHLGYTPIGICLQISIELFQLSTSYTHFSASVHSTSCASYCSSNNFLFCSIVCAGHCNYTITIVTGLCKNGCNVCSICQ